MKTAPSSQGVIRLRGVRVHNLKGIDLDLPRGRMTVIVGPSGAGKSSLALNTIYAEGQRRYIETFSASTRQFLEKLDKPDADVIEGVPAASLLSRQAIQRSARATMGAASETQDALALIYAKFGEVQCRECGKIVQPASMGLIKQFVEQLPEGTRYQIGFPVDLHAESNVNTIANWYRQEGFLRVWIDGQTHMLDEENLPRASRWDVITDRLVKGKETSQRISDSLETALSKGQGRCSILVEKTIHRFQRGWRCPDCGCRHAEPEPRLFQNRSPVGACPKCSGLGRQDESGNPNPLGSLICPDCQGTKLRPESLAVRLAGWRFPDLLAKTASEAKVFLQTQRKPSAEPLTNALWDRALARLETLEQVGLGTIPLDRPVKQLSGGEAQRLALTAALGSGLVGMLHVLDEPASGLHPRDLERLTPLLKQLRDRGNTVIVVDHDPTIIESADWIVEMGPGAGLEGGQVVFQGTLTDFQASKTVTAQTFASPPAIASRQRKQTKKTLKLKGATGKNLRSVDLELPLGLFCVITGVSGSGKSALILETLAPAVRKALGLAVDVPALPHISLDGWDALQAVEVIDAHPIGRSGRSNPATFLGAYGQIRSAFATTGEAKLRDYRPATFSFNVAGGRCNTCEGNGFLSIDMKFLPDVLVKCPDCQGARFRREVLDVTYRGKNIAEALDLTAREAFSYFKNQPKAQAKLRPLLDLGLDYLRLGQPASTLSGGEAQRLKLAKFLASTPSAVVRSSKAARTLYCLDEPTAGSHPVDHNRIAERIQSLVDLGHSVIVISHQPAIWKAADWIIELGPGSGVDGGQIVSAGPGKTS